MPRFEKFFLKKENIAATHTDTTDAMRAPGGRGLEEYEGILGFNRKDLDGKTVLDLGSGQLERLSKELKQQGINANVVSLNPDYALKKYRQIIKRQEDWQRKSVAGVGQALPFNDESFNYIVGLESVTLYEDALHEPVAAKAWAKEVARVLKPGGIARLGDILGLKGENKQKAWENIINILKAEGVNAEIEPFFYQGNLQPKHRLVISKP